MTLLHLVSAYLAAGLYYVGRELFAPRPNASLYPSLHPIVLLLAVAAWAPLSLTVVFRIGSAFGVTAGCRRFCRETLPPAGLALAVLLALRT